MARKHMIGIAAVVAAGALGGFGVSSAVATSPAGVHLNQGGGQVTFPNQGGSQAAFPKNARGETYGSGAFVKAGEEPDLISAIGDDHKTWGYVRKTDMASRAQPKNPEEVRARAASAQTGRVGDKVVPLYAQDGVTVVGSFTVKGWSVQASIPPKK
ncbi:hypothetical protein [Sinomonas sp. G460-2]|uniref:hypothetical protein n=1 Tax=Sinomonas sp. G460-2 TaxID=3393464 RepID=UPI0039F0A8A1